MSAEPSRAGARPPVGAPGRVAPSSPGPGQEGARSWRRLFLGWVGLPVLVVAALFGTGVHLGANYAEHSLTRAAIWLVDFIRGLF